MAGLWEAAQADERVRHYAVEGSFGYLHHSVRGGAELGAACHLPDVLLAATCAELEYSVEEFVGLLVSKAGRWAGDAMVSFYSDELDGAGLRRVLAYQATRAEALSSARAYAEEIAAGAR